MMTSRAYFSETDQPKNTHRFMRATGDRRPLKTSLILSVGLHVALVGLGVWALQTRTPPKPLKSVPVTLVVQAPARPSPPAPLPVAVPAPEPVAVPAPAPKAAEKPALKPAPAPQPVAAKPEPKPVPAKPLPPKPAPAPKAAPKAEAPPKPAPKVLTTPKAATSVVPPPAPKAVAKPTPPAAKPVSKAVAPAVSKPAVEAAKTSTPVPAKPVAAPAAKSTPAPTKPAPVAPARPAAAASKPAPAPATPDLDLDSLARGTPSSAKPTARELAIQRAAAGQARSSAPASSAAPSGTPGLGALTARLQDLWSPNCSSAGADAVEVSIRFTLNGSGRVSNGPAWKDVRSEPLYTAAASRAMAAVNAGQPYGDLPADLYNRPLVITFDAQKACRGQ